MADSPQERLEGAELREVKKLAGCRYPAGRDGARGGAEILAAPAAGGRGGPRPAVSETDSELARELERVESQAVREWGSGAPKDYFQTGNRSQKDYFQKGSQALWSGTTHPAGWPPDREDCGRCGLLPLRAPSWGIKGTRSEVVFWHKPSTTARSGWCGSHTALRTRAGNWALVIV